MGHFVLIFNPFFFFIFSLQLRVVLHRGTIMANSSFYQPWNPPLERLKRPRPQPQSVLLLKMKGNYSLIFYQLFIAHCRILAKKWPFLPRFSRQNWRVIFEVFQSNCDFAWLNSPGRSLLWENEWNNWEMFTSSVRSHNFKSDNISGKTLHCALLRKWENMR